MHKYIPLFIYIEVYIYINEFNTISIVNYKEKKN